MDLNRINELFASELKIVNLGIESFYRDLSEQKQQVIHVKWKPVAGGNERMAELLKLLK